MALRSTRFRSQKVWTRNERQALIAKAQQEFDRQDREKDMAEGTESAAMVKARKDNNSCAPPVLSDDDLMRRTDFEALVYGATEAEEKISALQEMLECTGGEGNHYRVTVARSVLSDIGNDMHTVVEFAQRLKAANDEATAAKLSK